MLNRSENIDPSLSDKIIRRGNLKQYERLRTRHRCYKWLALALYKIINSVNIVQTRLSVGLTSHFIQNIFVIHVVSVTFEFGSDLITVRNRKATLTLTIQVRSGRQVNH